MRYLIVILVLALGPRVSQAQFLKKLGKSAQKAAERTVERRVEKESSKKTDEALDEVFEGNSKKSKNKRAKKGRAGQRGTANYSARTAADFVRGSSAVLTGLVGAAAPVKIILAPGLACQMRMPSVRRARLLLIRFELGAHCGFQV